ncbi:MAG: DUF333 domain-containing protein [Candidatus Pacebacteria bacterium]|jgi:hypothetical protein|nr:DUF333 domain-containing protein [Candidatus Paceibacterota bacterium]
MKKILLFVILVIIAGAAFYYLNMVKTPAVQAPEGFAPPGTDTVPVGEAGDNGTGIANPASVYCGQQGGQTKIVEGEGGQQGICVLSNGAECDEWEFFRTKVCGATTTEPTVDNAVCGRENCHGLDIKCGANVAEICTMEYQLGDKCLRLVNCGVKDGKCQQIENAAFDACKTCVQKCQTDFADDQNKMFDCESKCPAENK